MRLIRALEAGWRDLPPFLAVALGAGVLLYFSGITEPGPGWLWLPAPLLVASVLLLHRAPLRAFGLGLLGAGALGFAVSLWHAGRAAPVVPIPARALVVQGVVQSVDLLPEGRRVTLAAARLDGGDPLPRTLRLRLRSGDPARPEPGDTVTLRALVRPPAPPAFPGAWDFQRAAYFAGTAGSGFGIGPAEVTRGQGSAPPLAGLRARIEARVTTALPGPAGAIAAALLTGGQSGIPAPDMAAMRDSGLAHLLSVSGLHIGIVMGLTFWLTRFGIACWPWLVLRVQSKPWGSVVALAAGAGYLLLTGLQVPMLRSFAMAAVVTLGVMLGRRAISMRVLAVAAAVVIFVNPAAILGPSFQMSFAAVLALIAGYEALQGRLLLWRGEGELWRRLAILMGGLVLTSVLAGAATTPFGLHHFGRLQVYGVAANALAVPITSVLVMPAGMLALALMPFGLENLALVPMGWGVEAILWVARGVAAWPGAALVARPLPAWGLAILSAGFCWLCLWKGRSRLAGVPLIVAGLLAGAVTRPPDALVSADARLVALHAPEGVFLWRATGANRLTRESWLRAYGEEEALALPAEARGAVDCAPGLCRLRLAGQEVALLLPPAPVRGVPRGNDRLTPPPGLCGTAAVVIAPEPLRGRCEGSQVIDRFSVWRDGAFAVWLSPAGARVVSDRAWRGVRPWVPGRPVPRGSPLPVAPSDPEPSPPA